MSNPVLRIGPDKLPTEYIRLRDEHLIFVRGTRTVAHVLDRHRPGVCCCGEPLASKTTLTSRRLPLAEVCGRCVYCLDAEVAGGAVSGWHIARETE